MRMNQAQQGNDERDAVSSSPTFEATSSTMQNENTSASLSSFSSSAVRQPLFQRFRRHKRRTKQQKQQHDERSATAIQATSPPSSSSRRPLPDPSSSSSAAAAIAEMLDEVRQGGPQHHTASHNTREEEEEYDEPWHRLSRTSLSLRRLAVLTSYQGSLSLQTDKRDKHNTNTRDDDDIIDEKPRIQTEPSTPSPSSSDPCCDSCAPIHTTSTTSDVSDRTHQRGSIFNSYLFCGGATAYDHVDDENGDEDDDIIATLPKSHSFPHLPDDPTVQESIECVFAHQLEEGALAEALRRQEHEQPHEKEEDIRDRLVSPAGLLQSKSGNRAQKGLQWLSAPRPRQSSSLTSQGDDPLAGKLVHVGTYDPSSGQLVAPTSPRRGQLLASDDHKRPLYQSHQSIHYSVTCPHCQQRLATPAVPPKAWPQRPLLLRPRPHSGMRILRVRYSSGKVFWKPGDTMDWATRLRKEEWGAVSDTGSSVEDDEDTAMLQETCPECLILPINNGNEAPGKSLVVDFESELFIGTILVRIRYAEGSTPEPYSDAKGYFHGMNRRYQIVIQGRFREAVPWTQCVAGMEFDRACAKLPPKWILKGSLKVLSFFAPHLQARFEGDKPASLTPLGSTPQMLRIEDDSEPDDRLEKMQEEPKDATMTLLGEASTGSSSMQRARFRKRNFDKLYVQQSHFPLTDPNKVYTFEFLQHLLNLQEFSIELGSMLGNVRLEETLGGQPLQIMAKCMDGRKLWAFDLWHECLFQDALAHDEKMRRG